MVSVRGKKDPLNIYIYLLPFQQITGNIRKKLISMEEEQERVMTSVSLKLCQISKYKK